MTAIITEPERIAPQVSIHVECRAADPELLLFDWLNALVYEMATRHMLFSEFKVDIAGEQLHAEVGGEAVDIGRHEPRVEIKGATFTELRVTQDAHGLWLAQCVLDV